MQDISSIESRLRFNGIDADTVAALRADKAFVLAELPKALDAFYRHIAAFPETASMFRDAGRIAHARAMQLRHWTIIVEARFDADYEASVGKIGRAHHRLGLEPRWYLGGYNFLVSALIEAIELRLPGRALGAAARARKARLQSAIVKAAMLDMDYAIAVYLEAGRAERRATLDRLAQTFEGSVASVVDGLTAAATQLQSAAIQLTTAAEDTTSRAGTVTVASREAADNVHAVAAASEEMASSVQEIRRQVETAASMAGRAAGSAGTAVATVEDLAAAAGRIGAVST